MANREWEKAKTDASNAASHAYDAAAYKVSDATFSAQHGAAKAQDLVNQVGREVGNTASKSA